MPLAQKDGTTVGDGPHSSMADGLHCASRIAAGAFLSGRRRLCGAERERPVPDSDPVATPPLHLWKETHGPE